MTRRFPRPWRVEELADCFKVLDANGGAVAYVYPREDPASLASGDAMTREQAKVIAWNIAKIGAEKPDA